MSKENVIDFEELEETESNGFLSKVKTGLKKHGKKIVAGAAVATVGLIGYALGSRSKDVEESELVDIYEIEDHSSDEVKTEG